MYTHTNIKAPFRNLCSPQQCVFAHTHTRMAAAAGVAETSTLIGERTVVAYPPARLSLCVLAVNAMRVFGGSVLWYTIALGITVLVEYNRHIDNHVTSNYTWMWLTGGGALLSLLWWGRHLEHPSVGFYSSTIATVSLVIATIYLNILSTNSADYTPAEQEVMRSKYLAAVLVAAACALNYWSCMVGERGGGWIHMLKTRRVMEAFFSEMSAATSIGSKEPVGKLGFPVSNPGPCVEQHNYMGVMRLGYPVTCLRCSVMFNAGGSAQVRAGQPDYACAQCKMFHYCCGEHRTEDRQRHSAYCAPSAITTGAATSIQVPPTTSASIAPPPYKTASPW